MTIAKRPSVEPADSQLDLDIDKWGLARMRRKTPRVPEEFDKTLGRILDEKVEVKTRVGTRLLTNREYFVARLHQRAKAGDPTARELVLPMMRAQTPEQVKARNEALRHQEEIARQPLWNREEMRRRFLGLRNLEQSDEQD